MNYENLIKLGARVYALCAELAVAERKFDAELEALASGRWAGRPRLNPAGGAKDKMFTVRLAPDEHAALMAAATRAGAKSASEWARGVLLAAAGQMTLKMLSTADGKT